MYVCLYKCIYVCRHPYTMGLWGHASPENFEEIGHFTVFLNTLLDLVVLFAKSFGVQNDLLIMLTSCSRKCEIYRVSVEGYIIIKRFVMSSADQPT